MTKGAPNDGDEASADDPMVSVRRQWNDWRCACYRLRDIDGLHWDTESGGINVRAPQKFLHGYVACNRMVRGELAHSCKHGQPPHRIKVCITKRGNEAIWELLLARAPAK